MPKQLNLENTESFGERMAKLRNAAGYSQRDLAKETGISQSMIAYYVQEQKSILHDLMVEAIEDIALANAIREGASSPSVSKKEIFDTLEG